MNAFGRVMREGARVSEGWKKNSNNNDNITTTHDRGVFCIWYEWGGLQFLYLFAINKKTYKDSFVAQTYISIVFEKVIDWNIGLKDYFFFLQSHCKYYFVGRYTLYHYTYNTSPYSIFSCLCPSVNYDTFYGMPYRSCNIGIAIKNTAFTSSPSTRI